MPPGSSTSTARPSAHADPARLGGAVFLDLDQARRRTIPSWLDRYLLTQAVTPVGRHLRGPARGVLDRRHAALRAQGREGRGAAVQPGRPGPRGSVSNTSHTLVVLEEGAEATLVRETSGQGSAGSPGVCTWERLEVFLGQGARLRLVNIQNWDETNVALQPRAGDCREATPSLQWTVGGLGSRLSKVNQEVVLAGQGAKAQVNGVMFTTGRQHLAYFTRQDHPSSPHDERPALTRWSLKDKSRIVWKGMIRVEKDAHTNRRLSEKRQPRPFALRPGRLDPRPGDRGQRCALHPRGDRGPGR